MLTLSAVQTAWRFLERGAQTHMEPTSSIHTKGRNAYVLIRKRRLTGAQEGPTFMQWEGSHKGPKIDSRVQLLATPHTAGHQAPLSMEFSRQEYWNGLPSFFPADLPNPGIEPRSPTLQADSLLSELPGKPLGQQ